MVSLLHRLQMARDEVTTAGAGASRPTHCRGCASTTTTIELKLHRRVGGAVIVVVVVGRLRQAMEAATMAGELKPRWQQDGVDGV